MKDAVLTVVGIILLLSGICFAADKPELSEERDRVRDSKSGAMLYKQYRQNKQTFAYRQMGNMRIQYAVPFW